MFPVDREYPMYSCAQNAGCCEVHSWETMAVMGPRPTPAWLGIHQSVFFTRSRQLYLRAGIWFLGFNVAL